MDSDELWRSIASGGAPDPGRAPAHDGRALICSVRAPRVGVRSARDVGGARVEVTEGRPRLVDVVWSKLHFQDCDFEDLMLERCHVVDCVFENVVWKSARLTDGTSVARCIFDRTNLANSFLGGGTAAGPRTTYQGIEFRRVDFRGSIALAATFEDCKFAKVRFATTVFRRCRFQGELKDVQFQRKDFKAGDAVLGELTDVDFSGATFVDVYFVGYDLDRVRLPENEGHFVMRDYRRRLAERIAALGDRSDVFSKQLRAYLRTHLDWAGPAQEQGVFSREDLVDVFGEKKAQTALDFLRAV